MTISLQPYTTPPGLLQWFREVLAEQETDVQLFVDPETDLEIGVFLPTQIIKQQISNALGSPCQQALQQDDVCLDQNLPPRSNPPQNPTSPHKSGPSSQAYGSDLDEAALTQLEESIQANPGPPIDPPDLVYLTTSKNRKRLQRRAEKKAKLKARAKGRPNRRKQLSARRVIPDSDSETGGEQQMNARPDQALAVDPWFDGVMREHGPIKPLLQSKIKKAAMAVTGRRAVQD